MAVLRKPEKAKAERLYSTMCANFKLVQEFGWYLPTLHSSFHFGSFSPAVDDERPISSSAARLGYKHAAVLFLVCLYKGSPHVLMTKRSQAVRTHKGLECLPGGRQEPGETNPIDTALREAHEETGLDPNLVNVVAVAPPFASGWAVLTAVTPVVCTLNVDPESLSLKPDNKEVDCVFWMPLEVFVESSHAEVVRRLWTRGGRPIHSSWTGFHFDCEDTGKHHFVWGLTALICISMTAIILNQAPAFPYSENVCLSSIVNDGKRLLVCMHHIALTTHHIDIWRDHSGVVKPNFSIDMWPSFDKLVSKL